MIYNMVQRLSVLSTHHYSADFPRIPMSLAVRRLRRTRRSFRRFFLVSFVIFMIAAALVVVGGRAESVSPTTMALLTEIAFVAVLASGTSLIALITTTAQMWRRGGVSPRRPKQPRRGEANQTQNHPMARTNSVQRKLIGAAT